MKMRRRVVGERIAADGSRETVEALRAEIEGVLAVEAWTLGAMLVEVSVPDRTGKMCNVCVRLPGLEDYLGPAQHHYVGPVLGRFARVISNGLLVVDGATYKLDCNIGGHHFHGGGDGFDQRIWQGDLQKHGNGIALCFTLESPDADQGYPGNLCAKVSYILTADGVLSIEFLATTDQPTVVSLTTHAFWNLTGKGTIHDNYLSLNTQAVIATDETFIPQNGPPKSVPTLLDFRRLRPLETTKIDHYFALSDDAWAAELWDPVSGRKLRLVTDQPGLAVYSGDHLPNPRAGLCLQPSGWPDAPNREDFPSARLDAGELYRHVSTFSFTVD